MLQKMEEALAALSSAPLFPVIDEGGDSPTSQLSSRSRRSVSSRSSRSTSSRDAERSGNNSSRGLVEDDGRSCGHSSRSSKSSWRGDEGKGQLESVGTIRWASDAH